MLTNECGFFDCLDSMFAAALVGVMGGVVLYWLAKSGKEKRMLTSTRGALNPRNWGRPLPEIEED